MNKHERISRHRKTALPERADVIDYVKRVVEQDRKRMTWAQIFERMQRLEPLRLDETSAEMIRRERDRL